MPELIRSFVCVEFPIEVKKEIARIQDLLESYNFKGKLTNPDNLHVTLKFLGEITPEKLEEVKAALAKVEFPKMRLKLANTGMFTKKGNPRIVWVRVNGDILELQRRVDEALAPLFPKEARFMSHLTIARVKEVNNKESFQNYVDSIHTRNLNFEMNEFKLMSSELNTEGPLYTEISNYSST